jgi:hypothetical protein
MAWAIEEQKENGRLHDIRACSGFSAVGKNRLIFCQFLRF